MIALHAPDVFAQWAVGILVWQVVIGRLRPVVFGAAWVMRVFTVVLSAAALASATLGEWVVAREVAVAAVLVLTVVALAQSVAATRAGRAPRAGGQGPSEDDVPVDTANRNGPVAVVEDIGGGNTATGIAYRLDALAAIIGTCGVVASLVATDGPVGLAVARGLICEVALGGLTFAMVFGHRMLAKPYLGRGPLECATSALLAVWPLEIVVMIVPTGMMSVLGGRIDDGYGGILGWMWALCAVSTLALLVVARVILADREHSSAASATGMLYLAALTGFGAVLISRAVLSG